MKAVIFDFDGVITCDSLKVSLEELKLLLGDTFKERDVYLLEGASIREILAEMVGKELDDPFVEELDRKKKELYRKDRKRVKPDEQAISMLERLKNRTRIALASGTRRENLESILGKRMELFDAIIAEEDVTKTKPDPEPYLLTAKKLGTEPRNCVAVENAPRGIRSAKRAGMACIAITTTLPEEYLTEADRIVHNYKEMENAIIEEIQ